MKYIYYFIILSCIFLTSISLMAQECTQYVGSCDYYLCREMNKKCSIKGYFINFGYKYCTKSINGLAAKISTEGKDWIVQTSICLQEHLDEVDDTNSCADIKMKATKLHDICYQKSNFCSLSLLDKLKIMKMLIASFKEKGVLFEGVQVFNQCLHQRTF